MISYFKKPVLFILGLAVFSAPVYAQQGSLSTCQAIKNKIIYYTDLRRNGGSVKQMETWKAKKHSYRKQFSKYKCREHGSKIKS
ncbi:MAG: hypothetical protein ACPGPF_02500 [Pontibacterium sp.]